ncbi:MAG: hopanoid biosynthesis-associated protein HpnK [Anaerolineae bacterium]
MNADDFGYSSAINTAVIRAHRQGVLTSASLMVAGDAAREAVELAREMPSLAVGLHLVIAGGRACLPPGDIPRLVDEQGRFPDEPFRLGLRYFFNRRVQEELRRELAAQFERFAATGLPLSHVDGHLHMHMHPTVFRLILPLATQYGAHGLRIVRDDLWLGLGYDRGRAGIKIAWALIFGLLSRWCLGRLGATGLVVADRTYGLMQSGHMQEAYVTRVLRRLNVPVAELYFHPSVEATGDAWGPGRDDLDTLLSPGVRQVIQERGLRLATYAMLRKV